MAEISFMGNRQLKTIAREWSTKFPYTYLRFFDHVGKSAPDWTVTHASIRGKKAAEDLSTNAGLKVSTFEARYSPLMEGLKHKKGTL